MFCMLRFWLVSLLSYDIVTELLSYFCVCIVLSSGWPKIPLGYTDGVIFGFRNWFILTVKAQTHPPHFRQPRYVTFCNDVCNINCISLLIYHHSLPAMAKVKVWILTGALSDSVASRSGSWLALADAAVMHFVPIQFIEAQTDSGTHSYGMPPTAPISHTRPCRLYYYSFPIQLRLGGWVGLEYTVG